jgi:hypothetical protein
MSFSGIVSQFDNTLFNAIQDAEIMDGMSDIQYYSRKRKSCDSDIEGYRGSKIVKIRENISLDSDLVSLKWYELLTKFNTCYINKDFAQLKQIIRVLIRVKDIKAQFLYSHLTKLSQVKEKYRMHLDVQRG